MITLTLPYPISANVYWRTRVVKTFAMTYVSAEAKSYKSQVAWAAKEAGIREPIRGRVAIQITLYPKRPQDWVKRAQKNPEFWDDDVMCIDLDNAHKVLFDSLKGIVIEDDKWIRKIESERAEPDGQARVVVTIKPIITQPRQMSIA